MVILVPVLPLNQSHIITHCDNGSLEPEGCRLIIILYYIILYYIILYYIILYYIILYYNTTLFFHENLTTV